VKRNDPNVNQGSIYNIGPRLESQGLIERAAAGWRLLDISRAPILTDTVAWGPHQGIFNKHEVAAHRRIAIMHLLESSSDGLQTMQITRHLKTWDFCKAPVDKDLVKWDITCLRKGKLVRQIGNTRKWTLIKEKAAK
jgi:hypothetical protein